uniref:NADH-ubiquinone oxidoreductase chain 3 n=1 Tax=Columbicola macrourae TaxID=128993 RepID=A0A6G7SJB8_9NEOP|nr:NADH dehydrogenase subunit 3 [Columbicola macrourae]
MNFVGVWLLASFFVSFFLWLLASFFSMDEESISANYSFECGFDCMSTNRGPFCIHFFLVAVLFLVFDVELMVSIPQSWMHLNWVVWVLIIWSFLVILGVGLALEIFLGSLDWDLSIN